MENNNEIKKKILVTGGAGGVGAYVCRRLSSQGRQVRLFDLPTDANKKAFRDCPGMELFWGDITDRNQVLGAMEGVDEVIHLAGLVPPMTEKNPQLARRINVEGSRTVAQSALEQSQAAGRPVTLRFSSSVTVFGLTDHLPPPIPPDQPVNPNDVYSETKVQAEEIIRDSGLPWTIFRFSAAVYLTLRKGMFAQMRIIPPDNRIELVHILDVAQAVSNSIDNPETMGKTFILGGGPRCQMLYRDQIRRQFRFLGLPDPDWRKFSRKPFNLDWYDTTESQRVLNFQNRTFDDYLADFKKTLGFKYPAMRYGAGPIMRLLRIHV